MSYTRYALVLFFFFNDTATTEIYTLSLHDALPIFVGVCQRDDPGFKGNVDRLHAGRISAPVEALVVVEDAPIHIDRKSTTSELQSRQYLVCRLLLEKKKKKIIHLPHQLFTLLIDI